MKLESKRTVFVYIRARNVWRDGSDSAFVMMNATSGPLRLRVTSRVKKEEVGLESRTIYCSMRSTEAESNLLVCMG